MDRAGRAAEAATCAAGSRAALLVGPADRRAVAVPRSDLRVDDHADPVVELRRLLPPPARL